jgi:hypothetical protein
MAWGTLILLRDLSSSKREGLGGGVLIFGWGASRNGLILLHFSTPGLFSNCWKYDLRYAVLLILASRTKSCGVLHEAILVPRINGRVVVFWAGSLSLSPHRLPKSQQKYIGGTSPVIGQQLRVTNKEDGAKSRNG